MTLSSGKKLPPPLVKMKNPLFTRREKSGACPVLRIDANEMISQNLIELLEKREITVAQLIKFNRYYSLFFF